MGTALKIAEYSYCKCGAVTLFYTNGENNSVCVNNAEKFIPDVRAQIGKAVMLQESYMCNYCVNKYGLDLCECGSGKSPVECCKKGSREELGKSVNLFEEMAKNQAKGGFW